MKRLLPVILCLCALVGCKDFQTKKLSSEKLVQDELKTIDWKSLDTYPSYDSCDDYSTKVLRKKCFEKETSKHIYRSLSEHKVTLKDSVHEKIELTIAISAKGKPSLDKAVIPKALKNEIPDIREWLEGAVTGLPKIYPAEKRGVPVSSKFKLPLVIESQKD